MKKIALFVLVLSAFLFESCTEKSVKEPKWKGATVTTTGELAPKVISQLTEDTKVIVTGEVKDDDSFFDEISEGLRKLQVNNGTKLEPVYKPLMKVYLDLSKVTGITVIGKYSFTECSSLNGITLPSSVTEIGYEAFGLCTSLTNITIPNSVAKIEDCAFWKCTSLVSITIPSSVTIIGSKAFAECSSLLNITIPSAVTSIEDYVVAGCFSLMSVTIPSTITKIEKCSFLGCKSLKTINYRGTQEQWNTIKINWSGWEAGKYTPDGNDALKTATINYNYKGK